MLKSLISAIVFATTISLSAQEMPTQWNTPGAGNPFIPGYFADPTIRKFGDTFYIYATTDGTGNGYGPAQVWMSKDFVNWRNVVMNWPVTEVVWAPEVIPTKDGKYRYYYCTPCQVYAGESDSPVGPWTNMLGRPDAVLMRDRYCDPMAITLDPQVFTDDDGSQYMFVGTWGIYEKSGCGWAKLAPDGKSFTDKGLVPNTQLTDFFEGPFVFKKDGIYYFTYSAGSCHNDTYQVRYATSTVSPIGPYTYKGPILVTNADGTVHGPGHHSILVDGNDYYIVYHRHNNPHSVHGFNRQLCIDKIEFDSNGDIMPIRPTHTGVLPSSLAKKAKKNTLPNLAYQVRVKASSELGNDFKAEYAVDDNNGTLWRPANNQGESWICLDLGKSTQFNQVWLQFEYPTFFYQYKIETSDDERQWTLFADKTKNTDAGSPMIEKGTARARYIKVTITDTQKNGHFGALWNVKVYKATKSNDPSALLPSVEGMDYEAVNRGYPNLHKKDLEPEQRVQYKDGLVVDINADDYAQGKALMLKSVQNRTGGVFTSDDELLLEIVQNKYAFYFDGKQHLTSSFNCPANFTYNAAYTISAWVLNPSVGASECIASVTPSSGDLTAFQFNHSKNRETGIIDHAGSFESAGFPNEVAQGEGKWQHWTVTYDGWFQRFYLNGRLIHEKNNFIMLRPSGPITIGSDPRGGDAFSGYIHSLRLYDRALRSDAVLADYQQKSDTQDKIEIDWDNIAVKTEVLTPTLVKVSVTDKEGSPLHSGQLYYYYYATSNPNEANNLPRSRLENGSTSNSSVMLTIDGKKDQHIYVDVCGQGGTLTINEHVTIDPKAFDIFTDDFKTFCEWDGKYVTNDKVKYEASNGVLTLTSASTDFSASGNPRTNGPMIYKEVQGDFIVQVRVADLMGSARRNTPAYNEGGLMVILPESDTRQQVVQLGVFPAYNCGNMLTTIFRGRPQYNNQQGWDYDPYMQLQRVGNLIYARTSRDGRSWTDMPASPVRVPQFEGKTLRVGLFQTTYSDNSAWVSFSDFILWQKK